MKEKGEILCFSFFLFFLTSGKCWIGSGLVWPTAWRPTFASLSILARPTIAILIQAGGMNTRRDTVWRALNHTGSGERCEVTIASRPLFLYGPLHLPNRRTEGIIDNRIPLNTRSFMKEEREAVHTVFELRTVPYYSNSYLFFIFFDLIFPPVRKDGDWYGGALWSTHLTLTKLTGRKTKIKTINEFIMIIMKSKTFCWMRTHIKHTDKQLSCWFWWGKWKCHIPEMVEREHR